MKTHTTHIEGLLVITPDMYTDQRGYFMETYNAERYKALGIPTFVQDNESMSSQHVLRGLHYQAPPYEQGKLVRVLQGTVLDVVVDIRPNSATFGDHYSIELSSENKLQFWIPPGFAHGFLTLSKTAVFAYKCTAPYHKDSDRGILWNDKELAIPWPVEQPYLSEKDRQQPAFAQVKAELYAHTRSA